MTSLTADLRTEGAELYNLMKKQPESFWQVKTQFKDWTVWDVIAHLHFSDYMAMTTAKSEAAFAELAGKVMVYFQNGKGLQGYARDWLGDISGPDLLEKWRADFLEMCDLFDGTEPDARLKWFGPDMGVRMFATARQMETWAHGQEIYDMLALDRTDTDRIKNIVVIGVKTFGFCFKTHGKPVPEETPFVSLTAPSGAEWAFGEPNSAGSIMGSAAEFAQVVTQTRNIADTGLKVEGDVANAWMVIAQCFAGGAEQPPKPGTRFKHARPVV